MEADWGLRSIRHLQGEALLQSLQFGQQNIGHGQSMALVWRSISGVPYNRTHTFQHSYSISVLIRNSFYLLAALRLRFTAAAISPYPRLLAERASETHGAAQEHQADPGCQGHCQGLCWVRAGRRGARFRADTG